MGPSRLNCADSGHWFGIETSAFFSRGNRITLWDSVGLYVVGIDYAMGNSKKCHNYKVTTEESLLKWRSEARLDEHNVIDGGCTADA